MAARAFEAWLDRRNAAVSLDAFAQGAPGSVQANVEVRDGNAERVRHCRRVLLVEVDAADYFGVHGAHLAEQPNRAPAGGRTRRLVHRGRLGKRRFGVRFEATSPVMVDDGPAQDSVKPCACARWVDDLRRALGRPDHRALHDVLGVCLGRDAAPRQAHEARALTAEPLDERARIHGCYRAFCAEREQAQPVSQVQGEQVQVGPHGQVAAGFGGFFC